MGLSYHSERDTASTRRTSVGRAGAEGLENGTSRLEPRRGSNNLPGLQEGKRASSAAVQPLLPGSPSNRARQRGSTAQESLGSIRSRKSLTVRTEGSTSRSSLIASSPQGSPKQLGSPQQLQDAQRRSAASPQSNPRTSLLATPAVHNRRSIGVIPAERRRRGSLLEDQHRSGRSTRPLEDSLLDSQPRHTFHTFDSLALLLAAQYGIGQPRMQRSYSRFSLSQRRWGQVKEAVSSLRLYTAKLKMQELTFFQKLQPSVQQQMLKAVQFAKLDKGSPLYLQGHVAGVDDPGNLYILISGEVAVQTVEDDQMLPMVEKAASVDKAEQPRNLGNVVATIQPGALLGHNSLLERRPRKNSCLCAVDSEFLILRKRDFDKILRSSLEALADGSANFLLQHVPGLRKLPRLKADQVMHSFQRTVFDRSHVFARQGDAGIAQAIYIVVRGCVEVRKGKHKVGMLIAGAIFGTAVMGEPEDFTIAVDSRQACEAFQVHGSALSALPQQMRTEIVKCITQLREWHSHREEELEISAKARSGTKLDGSLIKAVSLPSMPRPQSPGSPQRAQQRAPDTSYCEFPNCKSASRLGTSLKAARGRIFAAVEGGSADQLDARGSTAWGSPRESCSPGLPQVTQTPHKASRTTISEAREVLKKMRCSM